MTSSNSGPAQQSEASLSAPTLSPIDRTFTTGQAGEGVDLTLIQWMLELTPSERLDVLESFNASIHEIQNAEGSAAPDHP